MFRITEPTHAPDWLSRLSEVNKSRHTIHSHEIQYWQFAQMQQFVILYDSHFIIVRKFELN